MIQTGPSPKVLVAVAVILVAAASAAILRATQDGSDRRGQSIVLEDLRFSPNRLDAKVGVPITVTLQNGGTEPHDLNFPSLHMPGLAGIESILQPGESRTVTLRFDEVGEHVFSCSLPGHAAAGMTGAVFLKP